MTHAAAAAKGDRPAETRTAKPAHSARSTSTSTSTRAQLEQKLDLARKQRSIIRFFANHPRLLSSAEDGETARASLRRARSLLAKAEKDVTRLRRVVEAREERRLEALPPKAAICDVFDRYCDQAVQVAWCESRLHTDAENGQYRGLFQMGSYARELYGHGSTAHDQAVAAHRYFVSSGRDWSPWSCKPWAT